MTAVTNAWEAANRLLLQETKVRHVPEELRLAYSQGTSLRQFYEDCLQGRWEPIGIKKSRSRGTLNKEKQALNRWEKYTQPIDWEGPDWPGPSLHTISLLGGEWFETLWDRMQQCMAVDTVKSTRGHLRVLLRHAVKVKAIQSFLIGRPLDQSTARTLIYTPAQVSDILQRLKGEPLLHAAFWLALHAGLRSEDLFLIRWGDFITDHRGRLLLDIQARKTRKLQAIPIAPCVWEVLNALPRVSDYVFPGLSNAESKDPEKSWQARSRNTRMKAVLAELGIELPKPWQVGRSTCNERYESHMVGSGAFILGHSLSGVNARSYRQPTEYVFKAVLTLPAYELIDRQRKLF